MMSARRTIFEQTDPGGNWMRVGAGAGASISSLTVTTGMDSRPVLNRDDVRMLHDALGAWLAEQDGVKCVPAPLTPADVRAIITEHVASVMPLYLAPFSALVKAPEAYAPDADAEDGWQTVDPEPGDVGHPRPLYVDASPHPVNDRASAGAPVGPTWDDKVWGATGTPPGAPDCIGCAHPYSVHFTGEGCMDLSKGACRCARYRSTR